VLRTPAKGTGPTHQSPIGNGHSPPFALQLPTFHRLRRTEHKTLVY